MNSAILPILKIALKPFQNVRNAVHLTLNALDGLTGLQDRRPGPFYHAYPAARDHAYPVIGLGI